MLRKKTEEISIFGHLWELILWTLKNIGSLEDRAKRSFEKHKTAFQNWMLKTIVLGLSIFMSLAFLVLGLSFIAIDYGGIPRGIVFTCGGLSGLLVLKLMVPSTK